MITYKVEGVNRTVKNLMNYSLKIRSRVWNDVVFIGNEVKNKIRADFPQALITSEEDPNQMKYIILVENLVVCSVSGLVILTGPEKSSSYKGQGYFDSAEDLENYKRKLINYYFTMAKERIINTVHLILK